MLNSIRKSLYSFYLEVNRILGFTEKLYAGNNFEPVLEYRPIFILGAPRTGTTLLYQTIVSVFNIAYLSNAHCFLHGLPWLVEVLLHPSQRYKGTSYKSRYGAIKGYTSPSECGNYWYRFFSKDPQYVTLEQSDFAQLKKLRISIRAITKAAGNHILLKNLPCTLRLEPILEALPEALFIVLHRNEKDTAHSILEARKNLYGTYNHWFSIEPPNIKELQAYPPVRQVLEQIRTTYSLIEKAEQHSDTFFHLHYDKFCNNPSLALKKIESFFIQHNVNLPMSGNLPKHFEQREGIRIDKNLYNELLQHTGKNNCQ